ncbi:MAG: hypothetical protein F6K23_17345 [Okeania sp. SIO2C9]|nr:hypothetical protein [Okeania sp. SIO2C9]
MISCPAASVLYSKGKEEGRGKKEEGREKRKKGYPRKKKTIISCRYSPLGLHKRYKRT